MAFIATRTLPDFDAKFASWLEACNNLRNDYYSNNPTRSLNIRHVLTPREGKRYIKIFAEEYDIAEPSDEPVYTCIWALIDKTNGNVLKADGVNRPAKGARGNIFDEVNGLGRIGIYGPAYNR